MQKETKSKRILAFPFLGDANTKYHLLPQIENWEHEQRLTFVVYDPITTNQAYFIGKGYLFKGSAGKKFDEDIKKSALEALETYVWVDNLLLPKRVRIHYQLYDFKGDTDGSRKLIRDALEGILYVNDNVVEDGLSPLSIQDGNGRRVLIVVDLLEQHTEDEMEVLKEKIAKAKANKLVAKEKKAKKEQAQA